MSNNNQQKQKYWVGVLYPENMVDDWQLQIDELLQLPFAYCIHDKDKTSKEEEDRKLHVHIMIAFPNTTTYNHALNVFKRLSAPDKQALNKCEAIINVRWMYDYLIHDTDACRKKGKYQYSPSERISGNNFDIGAYEQISIADKQRMCKELANDIISCSFTNFADFYYYVMTTYSEEYFEILIGYTSFFKALIGGVYHKVYQEHSFQDTTT